MHFQKTKRLQTRETALERFQKSKTTPARITRWCRGVKKASKSWPQRF
jgi:hypothetical protein